MKKKIEKISIIIPFYNEAESLNELIDLLEKYCPEISYPYEIIFIDDLSTDGGPKIVRGRAKFNKNIILIELRKNSGKISAQKRGIEKSSGTIIVTMDSDLQHSPEDISKMIREIESGAGLVIGERLKKETGIRSLSSKILNLYQYIFLGIKTNDFFSGLKAFRREVISKELQEDYTKIRYIPFYTKVLGYKVGTIKIKDQKRKYGESKYGMRLLGIALNDLLQITKLGILHKRGWLKIGIISVLILTPTLLLKNIKITSYYEDPNLLTYFRGNPLLLEPPTSNTIIGIPISTTSVMLEFPFSEPININGFTLHFRGNLNDTSSFSPKIFNVYKKDSVGNISLLEKVTSHRSDIYSYKSHKKIEVSSFIIELREANYKNLVMVEDFKVLGTKKITLGRSILNSVRTDKGVFHRIFYNIFFYLFLVFPGYCLVRLLSKKGGEDKPERDIVYSPLPSLGILLILSVTYWITGMVGFLYAYIPIALVLSLLSLNSGIISTIKKSITPITIMFLAISVAMLLQYYRESIFNLNYIEKYYLDTINNIPITGYYGYHIDNTLPWATARAFLRRISVFSQEASNLRFDHPVSSVLDKPPTLALILVPIIKIFGESHFIYQQFMNVLMGFYYLGAYYFISRHVNKRVGKLVQMMMVINLCLTYWISISEVFNKYLSWFPIFLAYSILLDKDSDHKNKELKIAGLLLISLAIHPLALIPTSVIGFYYLYKYRFTKKFFQKSLVTFVPVLLLLIFMFSYGRNLRSQKSENYYLKQIESFTWKHVLIKGANHVDMFVPDFMGKGLKTKKNVTCKEFFGYYSRIFFMYSLIASISPFILVKGLMYTLKSSVRERAFLWLGVGTMLIYILYLNRYSLGRHALMYPILIPILLAFIMKNLLEKESKKIQKIAILTYIFFQALSVYFSSWIFNKMKFVDQESILGFLLLMVSFVTYSLLLFKELLKTQKHNY